MAPMPTRRLKPWPNWSKGASAKCQSRMAGRDLPSSHSANFEICSFRMNYPMPRLREPKGRQEFLPVLRACGTTTEFLLFCREPLPSRSAPRRPCSFQRPTASPSPDIRRSVTQVARRLRTRAAADCAGRNPAAICAPAGSPRPHPYVQESKVTHEKRNAHQRLAAGGVPDRDC